MSAHNALEEGSNPAKRRFLIVTGHDMEVMIDLMGDGGDEIGDEDPCGLAAVCNQEVRLLSS
jgi:hypothetical protein